MTLKDALKIMKQQAAEMAVKAQMQAEEAAWQRAEAGELSVVLLCAALVALLMPTCQLHTSRPQQ